MIIAVVLILLAVILLGLCAAIGVISIIVVIDDHRGSRSGARPDRSPTRPEATARRILGAGSRNERERGQ
jgi:hypothetical protein